MHRAALLSRVGNDPELLKEIVGLFFDECPKALSAIRQAVERRDANAVEFSAHALKSMIGNFTVSGAWQAALDLEMMGRESELANADNA
ncbi:MAG: Hpt domain-containing protein, partial [Acidobacteria bacterium]|nr:Hpt domain-containing protein [Acidobacteriota bacterium]